MAKLNAKSLEPFFSISSDIRYVALYHSGHLVSKARPDLKNSSGSESDKFEELLVNPTLITLLRQRGEIDCGGFAYALIRYGNFFQLVYPFEDGHLSVCIEADGEPHELILPISHILGSIMPRQNPD